MEKMRDNANDERQKFAGLMFGMLLIRLFGLNHSLMEFNTFGYLSERLYQLSNVEDSLEIPSLLHCPASQTTSYLEVM